MSEFFGVNASEMADVDCVVDEFAGLILVDEDDCSFLGSAEGD